MTNWYEKPGAGWLLRLCGLMLIGAAVLAIALLYHLEHQAPLHDATLDEIGLALIGFITASTGSTTLVVGKRIFDHVEVSRRWM
jgi:hypothetical protein